MDRLAAIVTVGPMLPALPGSFWVSAECFFQPRHYVWQAFGEGRKEHTSQNHTAAALLTGMSVRTVAAVLLVVRRRGGAARCTIVASVVVDPGFSDLFRALGIASVTSQCGWLLIAKQVRFFNCFSRSAEDVAGAQAGWWVAVGSVLFRSSLHSIFLRVPL